jgi:hypothetical protein
MCEHGVLGWFAKRLQGIRLQVFLGTGAKSKGENVIEQPTIHRRNGVATAIGVLSTVYAATFFFGALLHLGVTVPLGFTVLGEPRIIPASIVEGLCGLALAVAAFAVLALRDWAWTAALAANAFALGGVLLGITALAAGTGPSTELNTIYHRVMVVALVAVLALLLSPTGRAALRRATSPTVIQSR